MRTPSILGLLLAMLALPATLHAGTLSLGQPGIQENQYLFPVALAGADAQVSALDFRLQFDPRVFVPVSVSAGPSALAANKMVSANNAAPGQFVVVMMGLNQSTIPGGVVASVLFQRTGDGDGALATTVGISDLTLAGPDGNELSASGSSVSVPLREATAGETTEGEEAPAEAPESPNPAPTGAPTANPPTSPAPQGTATAIAPRRLLAGSPADNASGPTTADLPRNAQSGKAKNVLSPGVPSALPDTTAPQDAEYIENKELPPSVGMSTPLPLPRNTSAANTADPAGGHSGQKNFAPLPTATENRDILGADSGAGKQGDKVVVPESGTAGAVLPIVGGLLFCAVVGLLLGAWWRRSR